MRDNNQFFEFQICPLTDISTIVINQIPLGGTSYFPPKADVWRMCQNILKLDLICVKLTISWTWEILKHIVPKQRLKTTRLHLKSFKKGISVIILSMAVSIYQFFKNGLSLFHIPYKRCYIMIPPKDRSYRAQAPLLYQVWTCVIIACSKTKSEAICTIGSIGVPF